MVIRKHNAIAAAAAISMAAAVSCSKAFDMGVVPDEGYVLITSGAVFNAESIKPLEGIKVSIKSYLPDSHNEVCGEEFAYTDSKGEFKVIVEKVSGMNCLITAEDVDGADNGGEFETAIIDIREIGDKTFTLNNQQFYLKQK